MPLRFRILPPILALAVAVASGLPLLAFNGHVVTEGSLTLTLAEIPPVLRADALQTCLVRLANAGSLPLSVTLALTPLADDLTAVGPTQQTVLVPAGRDATAVFGFTCARATHPAHYPLHVQATFNVNGTTHTARAVRIFTTDFAAPPATVPDPDRSLAPVPLQSTFALATAATTATRIAWSQSGGPLVRLPPGWSGTDAISAASFHRASVTRGGVTRASLQLHPPYRTRPGTVFAEYRLQLPATTPLGFEFFTAIRDSAPAEGASDGVTFRVWADEQVLFERHSDSKTWIPGNADLGAFAGREILLRLESHPGPRNNTSCDLSFWGDPTVTVGPRPPLLDEAGRTALAARTRAAVASGQVAPDRATLLYELEGGCRAVVALGPNGLADGCIGFGTSEHQVVFAGLHLALRDHVVGTWPSAALVRSVNTTTDAAGRTRITHRVGLGADTTELVATVWSEGPALRIKVESAERITGLGLNPADQRAPRVFYGHGYAIVDPQAFRASADGHNLSTSHVGFEFEGGVALLTATDTPPDFLQVDPARRLYQLHTHPDATLTFVPGLKGAFDCAVRYRPLHEKTAAPGVARKAGRFVFDLWGGRYADNAAKLARCFDYGLTHSLAIVHTWQRWGYDYRLPDIFPPLPSLGTLADLQAFGRTCTARGVAWGVHDNYIDIYPDADGFSYDQVTFTAEGRPRRAWLNESRDAQSYQFRPDRFRPFLDRNLGLLAPALQPTATFVDVFASMAPFDFRDRAGNFHSKRETQRAWGEAFAAIRAACAAPALTVSEAGHDHLIGWLDGADAQLLQLGDKPERFHHVVRCRDWERVPWFDAVNHTRFSLHGAGYSDRYQGGRSREEHGIESDDYLSAELLTGHALMIDRPALERGAVRKYWLAQDFIESVAHDEIRDVAFAGGDLHRQVVTWNSGARVCVNRGASDWTVEGHTLPQYGYWARHGELESAIERFGDAIAERSRAPGRAYFNSRVFAPAAPLALTPRARSVEYLGGRQFKLLVDWDALRATPQPLTVFYHFSRPTPGRRTPTEFVSGGAPLPATTQWQGRVTTGDVWPVAIPAGMPPGDYEILVGLYDPKNRNQRERLQGDEDNHRRYRIGKLIVQGGKAGDITGVRLETPAAPQATSGRWLANRDAVDFGAVWTDGAFRCEVKRDQLIVTPLPDGPAFTVRLRVSRLVGRTAGVGSVEAIDARGAAHGSVAHTQDGDELSFTTNPADFAYRINLR